MPDNLGGNPKYLTQGWIDMDNSKKFSMKILVENPPVELLFPSLGNTLPITGVLHIIRLGKPFDECPAEFYQLADVQIVMSDPG